MKNKLLNQFGTIPLEPLEKSRIRIHQGWWRMNVLHEPPGKHPNNENENVCNTILNGEPSGLNFLTENTKKAVAKTIAGRNEKSSGKIEKDRLFNNLLSSQPLCFNFFGELMEDAEFGLRVLQIWWPELTELKRVILEFGPEERYTGDNSAFDVAFEVSAGDKSGLIGLECKYTDTFSATEYDREEYYEIYKKSNAFNAPFERLKSSQYNQLFRNQLIAEGLIQNNKYDFVRTGLFCYELDHTAIETAQELQQMLSHPESFKIISYRNFIEKVQQLDLEWEKREWTILLWARYCGLQLSEKIYNELQK